MIRVATLSLIRLSSIKDARRDNRAPLGLRTVAADALVTVSAVVLAMIAVHAVRGMLIPVGAAGVPATISLDQALLPAYAVRSVLRMLIAIAFSFAFALVYGLACARCPRARTVLLPLLDVLQSVPVLGFLSATVTMWLALFPGSMLGVEAAAIFAIFTSQAWNMALSFYQSLISEPAELDEMARSFRLTRWQRFWKLDVAFGLQQLVWNAMMSMGGAWFFLSASELISVNGATMALPGLGTYAALAAEAGRTDLVVRAVAAMALVIVGMDLLMWRPLLAWADRFQVGLSGGAMSRRRSGLLDILHASRVAGAVTAVCRVLMGALDVPMGVLLGRTGTPSRMVGVMDGAAERLPMPRCADAVARVARSLARPALALAAVISALAVGHAVLPVLARLGWEEAVRVLALGGLTLLRVGAVTVLCSLIWVPIGICVGLSPRLMRIAQPAVQLAASFPSSFLFPLIAVALVGAGIDLGLGSVLFMALGAQWYILFNVIGAAAAIPSEVLELAAIMRMPRTQRWREVYLPAVFGPWVAGALATAGGAWNASIVAEVVTMGARAVSTPGLGSYIAAATGDGDAARAALGIAVMCVFVVVVNALVWKPLQRVASERFSLM